MNQRDEREERAFEGLVVDALRKGEQEEICIEGIREPNETELAALRLLGDDFIERLVSGKLSATGAAAVPPCVAGPAVPLAEHGLVLYRSEGVDAKTQEELDKADREVIERKKRERDGEAT